MPHYRNTTRRYHSKECLCVQHKKDFKSTKVVDEQPEGSKKCALCKLGITQDEERLAPRATQLLRLICEKNDFSSGDIHDALRSLISETEKRIQERGYLKENVGVSVKSISHWKSERKSATTYRFDKVVYDALEVNLIFDLAYKQKVGYTTVEEYLKDCSNGNTGSGPDQNVAKTIEWLKKYDQESTLPVINQILQENIKNEDTETVILRPTCETKSTDTDNNKDQQTSNEDTEAKNVQQTLV